MYRKVLCVFASVFAGGDILHLLVMYNINRKLPLVQSTDLIRFHQFYMPLFVCL